MIDHFQATHIYVIPTSRWKNIATSMECATCKSQVPYDEDEYEAFMSLSVEDVPLEELLKNTNPKLVFELRDSAYQETFQKEPKDRDPHQILETEVVRDSESIRVSLDDDSELKQIRYRMADLEANDVDVMKVLEKLKFWKSLNDRQRQELNELVDECCGKEGRINEAKEFLMTVGTLTPNRADKVALMGFLLTAIPCFSAMYIFPINWTWYLIATYVVVLGVALMAVFSFVIQAITKSWCRDTLIPEAVAKGISLKTLLLAVERMDSWTDEEKKRAGNLNQQDIVLVLEKRIASQER